MTLPVMVQRLQKRIDADWEECTVVVSNTDQDLVQIAFHMATVDSERGVLAYMNVLSKDVELLGTLALRKVSQLWGMKRDFSNEMITSPKEKEEKTEANEHVWTFFLMTPKWVKMRPTDAYYTVHPRAEGTAFRMSTAGSSVLLSLAPLMSASVNASDGSLPSPIAAARPSSGQLAQPRSLKVDMSMIEAAMRSFPSKPRSQV